MRPLRSLSVYLAAVFLVGALAAPWLHAAAQELARHAPAFEKVAQAPFHRYVSRALLITALIGLWPLLRILRACSLLELGLTGREGVGKRFGAGFAMGFISLACVALLALGAGARRFPPGLSTGAVLSTIANAALSALVVALLEEVLFRGAIFGAIRKAHDWRIALVASSAVYALVHFFERARSPDQVAWFSGFETLGQMVQGFGDMKMLVPGFFSLSLAGMILGLGYHQSGSLYFSIGLHAGWIFWLKLYGALTVEQAGTGAGVWFWGSRKLIDGWSALGVLGPLFLFLWFRPARPGRSSHDG